MSESAYSAVEPGRMLTPVTDPAEPPCPMCKGECIPARDSRRGSMQSRCTRMQPPVLHQLPKESPMTTPTRERVERDGMNLNDLMTLTSYMAERGDSAQEVAYAVEKPWKFVDTLLEAVAALDA